MKLMKRSLAGLSFGVIVAVTMGGGWILPASADSTTDGTPIAVPVPAIPDVAALPGPIADAATPIQTMGTLTVTPNTGVTGTPVTISGSGLQPSTQVTLTWSTANVTWMLDAQPATVNYRGRSVTPVTVVIQKVTTDATGAFSTTLRHPTTGAESTTSTRSSTARRSLTVDS